MVHSKEMANIIPERLRALRKEARETQQDLAVVIDKDRSFISLFEAGTHDPSLEDVVKIARHYGVSPDYLTGWSARRLPLDSEQAGHQLDERTLAATLRRVLREINGAADLPRIKGPIASRRRKALRSPRENDDTTQ